MKYKTKQKLETLVHGKGCFQGNKDDRMMCESCYEEAHGELP